jgi:4-amino-4-deoxy-L-arabinose transferase-like glycosyltransferase
MVAALHALPRYLMVTGFAIALFVAAGSPLLPLGPDQAMFAWVGSVILDGGVPYTDAWDIKGPLTHYVYALAAALFGRQEFSIRILDIIAVLSCSWLLRRLVLRLSGDNGFSANCAVILFCLNYYAGGYADTAQPDGWGGMVILGVAALLLGTSSRPYFVMSTVGALIALAALFKPTFLIYALLPCAFATAQREPVTRRLLLLASCLLAFSVVVVAAILLLARAGALRDFLDVQRYLYTTYQHNGHTLFSVFTVLPWTLYNFGLLIPYLLVPIGLWRIRAHSSNRCAAFVTVWFILANIAVIVQGRYWQDHMLPAATATALIAGVALGYLGHQSINLKQPRPAAYALGLFVLLAALAPVAGRALSRNNQWLAYLAGFETRADYIAQVMKPFNEVREPFNYLELRALSEYIAQHSQPDDRLVVWGWDVSVFNMSGRRSATRFGVFQPLIAEGPVQDHYRRRFLQEITSCSPAYIIVDTRGAWFFRDGAGLGLLDEFPEDIRGLKLLDEFPEFRQLVHSQYRLASTVGVYQVWTRLR